MKRRVSPEEFLEAHDGLDIGEIGQHLRRDIDLIDGRVVVDHEGQVHRPADGAIMRHGLKGLGGIDERRHDHHAVEPDLFGGARRLDGEGRGVFGDAADNRHAFAGDRFRHLIDGTLLACRERAALAHRAADDEARHAIADETFDDARGGVEIEGERPIILELGGDGREDAGPGTTARRHGEPHCSGFGAGLHI